MIEHQWQKVSFAADIGDIDDHLNSNENCSLCGQLYDECPCPGPTQDGYEYEERSDGLYARKIPVLSDFEHSRMIGRKPYRAQLVKEFRPCYECGMENHDDWGWQVLSKEGQIAFGQLSRTEAEFLAFLLNSQQ